MDKHLITTGVIRITPAFLELGDYYDATITVHSIRGATINRVTITNQNRVALGTLIPSTFSSQAVIISITVDSRVINIRSIKCGTVWLCNDRPVIETSHSLLRKKAAAAIIDTLLVEKDNMQTVAVPISTYVATLPDIILNYAYIPVDKSNKGKTTLLGDIAFSVPSGLFKNELSVTLTTKVTGAEIHFTIDGTVPVATSALYSMPIAINRTTQVRAAAFVAGVQSGAMSTAIYIACDFDYTSDIPIIIMEGYGGGKPKDKYHFIDLGFMSFEPVQGVASLCNPPTIITRAGYHLRGQSSCGFLQAPYRVELWDNENDDAEYPLCGMPAGADWAFISPFTDYSLIRNVFAFNMGKAIGLATVQYRFAEVFIKQDSSGILQKSDYQGIYQIIQPIKNRKNTIDLKKLDSTDTDPAILSGGYILRFDQSVNDSGMIKLECIGAPKMTRTTGRNTMRDTIPATCFADLELVAPSSPNRQQISWITNYIQQFHDALHEDPAGDWRSLVDVNSFVNIHILNEITCDVDAWTRSHFLYKERNKPLTAGPVWDYNFALGNMSFGSNKGWYINSVRQGSNDWHTLMWLQPEFQSLFKNRFSELRKAVLSDSSIEDMINKVKKPIDNIAERNFTAWPMKNQSMNDMDMEAMAACMGFSFGGGGADDLADGLKKEKFGGFSKLSDTTWTGQIDSLKVWTIKRLKILDSLVNTLP